MPQTILLIDENSVAAQTIRDALTGASDEAFELEWVSSCSAGLKRLAGVKPEKPGRQNVHDVAAVLIDLATPESGLAVVDSIIAAASRIPILILCNEYDEATAREAVHRGAQDYLLKSRLDRYVLAKTVSTMIARAANEATLLEKSDRAQITLNAIGDAIISTDALGTVTYLNAVAEQLTGWTCNEAVGRAIEEVFKIVNANSREVPNNPMIAAIHENKASGLTVDCLLVRRDGVEMPIEDSASPIRDRDGKVLGAVIVFRDVTAQRAQSSRMSYLAQHDSLTDLPNRLLLNDRLTQAMALARRHRQKLAVLFVDVDRFKSINDSLGHAIGDCLLQSVAKRLSGCVRSLDTVSRQGGDEFAVLLAEVAHANDAAIIADKILLAMRAPHRIDQHDLYVTASIGIATYPEDGNEVDALLRKADSAMYQAKEYGRDNYQFFLTEMNVLAVQRQSLESGLRSAMMREEFVLHYQPKMNLESNAIVGVEALIRWRHPQRGLVPPAQFIPVAEECGFIVPIGRWILREACRQARAWQDAGLPPMTVSVNISTVELRAKSFVAGVRTILQETGLEPHYLELEVTESCLAQDANSCVEILESLNVLGVHLTLDDFGTGSSSLSNLQRFPINSLKIDKSFVRDLTTDMDDANIVSAVIGVGKSLRMRVVAEGVETLEQLAFLRQAQCPEAQGYYFSQPVDASEIGKLLRQGQPLQLGATTRFT